MPDTTSQAQNQGPFIQAALFCDKVLEEKDGVLTPVRLVDRFVFQRTGTSTDPPPPTSIQGSLLIALKSGEARGSHDLKIQLERPSGLRDDGMMLSLLFEGEDRGANVIVPISMALEEAGLYWFDILLNDRLITRVPLRVVHQTIQPARASNALPSE